MPRLAVLGYPVSHSRSPAMQNAALAELGLADRWSYEAIEVAPDRFAALVASLPGDDYAGVNVTVPHKLAALKAAGEASDSARAIGAANVLSFPGEGRVVAENTDAAGIEAAIGEPLAGRRALVIGAGGSARAAIWALREAGAGVSVWNRTGSRAEAVAAELRVEAVATAKPPVAGDYELILNATTLGLEQANSRPAAPGDLKQLPFDADAIEARQIVVDLVYGSHETALASQARERGARVIDGLEVLVHQGAASLRIWTGLTPPIETMRQAARE
ncbi:MAG: shikimate dehydrogenase [Solirubrobacterales bacterium]|jgi:shikimate dehydrogenase|nr:shikimate dehydrogenase [Solirubrobacterales bacterium]